MVINGVANSIIKNADKRIRDYVKKWKVLSSKKFFMMIVAFFAQKMVFSLKKSLLMKALIVL